MGRTALLVVLVLSALATPTCRRATHAPAADANGPRAEAAAAELAELAAQLRPLLERPEWPADLWLGLGSDPDVASAEARNPLPGVSARLALFERRFGSPPDQSPGWDDLEQLAHQLHRRMEVASPEHAGGLALDGLARVEPPWLTARTLLLELVGRRDEARALLLDESPRWLWPGHWMIEAQLVFVLASARALQRDRAGATDEALRWGLAAWFWGTCDDLADDFGHHRHGIDWVLAHVAVLLAEADEWTAARAVLADLQHLRPDADGTRFARSRLAEALEAQPVTSEELIVEDVAAAGRRGRVYAVGDPYDAATWRVLAVVEWLQTRYVRGQPHPGSELRALAPEDPRAAELIAALPPHANPFR